MTAIIDLKFEVGQPVKIHERIIYGKWSPDDLRSTTIEERILYGFVKEILSSGNIATYAIGCFPYNIHLDSGLMVIPGTHPNNEILKFLGHDGWIVYPSNIHEVLAESQKVIDSYEQDISQGGLLGCVKAREQYFLQGILDEIKDAEKAQPWVLNKRMELIQPSTGSYVVSVISPDAEEEIFGLTADLPYCETAVANIVKTQRNDKSNNTTYKAFQVPDSLVSIVEDSNPVALLRFSALELGLS